MATLVQVSESTYVMTGQKPLRNERKTTQGIE